MRTKFYSYLNERLDALKQNNLYRKMQTGEQMAHFANYCSSELLLMNTNNYLGLAQDERLKQAAAESAKSGAGSTGSRLISGTHSVHFELENALAQLKGTEKAILFATGYMANVGAITALMGPEDAVYSDELNHASIIDGIKLSRTNKFIYRHSDTAHLEELLERNADKYRFNFIITDTVFSMDGDIAPLKEIVAVKNRHGALLYVDEAHAFGVFGNNGAGLVHHCGLKDDVDVQMGTLSKAAGSEGGYVCGSAELVDYITNTARSFIFSTAPSLPSVATSLRSVEIIRDDAPLRAALHKNIETFSHLLKEVSFSTGIEVFPSESAIFCIKVGDTQHTIDFSQKLLEEYGIWATAIRPPTVKTSRIRFCVNAKNTQAQLEYVAQAIEKTAQCFLESPNKKL